MFMGFFLYASDGRWHIVHYNQNKSDGGESTRFRDAGRLGRTVGMNEPCLFELSNYRQWRRTILSAATRDTFS